MVSSFSEKEGLIYGLEEEKELDKGLPLFFLNNSTTIGQVLHCIFKWLQNLP